MSLELVSELWDHVKTGMSKVDRESTADFIVTMFADHGFSSSEIKDVFATDTDIKNAIVEYFGEDEAEYEEDEDGYDEEDEDYEDDDY
jgi:hypothetical protein